MNKMQFMLLLTLLCASWVRGQKPYYSPKSVDWEMDSIQGDILHTIYLVGDAGEQDKMDPSALDILFVHLKRETGNSTLVFLGDNSYPNGLPKSESNILNRTMAEANFKRQFDIVEGYKGKVYFIPGNHDWDKFGKNGWEGVKREEKYVESELNRGNSFLPDMGCPGPVEVQINEHVLLIIIDTQWWLHKYEKPNSDGSNCEVSNDTDFIERLSEIIRVNNDKEIIVTAHHPIYSNGNHGGYIGLKDRIFPLAAFVPQIIIPLPIGGTIYAIFRKLGGSVQDIPNQRYQLLKAELLEAFKGHDNLIYATGHDHNLQYRMENNQHYIVSGSGSKNKYVAKGKGASFTYAKQGFSKVIYLDSGEVWVEFWTTSKLGNNQGELMYRQKIKGAE